MLQWCLGKLAAEGIASNLREQKHMIRKKEKRNEYGSCLQPKTRQYDGMRRQKKWIRKATMEMTALVWTLLFW